MGKISRKTAAAGYIFDASNPVPHFENASLSIPKGINMAEAGKEKTRLAYKWGNLERESSDIHRTCFVHFQCQYN